MDVYELLIDLMCEGNEDAFISFRERYLKFIRYWIKSYKNIIDYLRLDEEDFVGEIYMHIYYSISSYNGNCGHFYAYAKKCAQNYILTYLKRMDSDSRRTILGSLSIDSAIDDMHTFEDLVQCEYLIAYIDKRYESREVIDDMIDVINEFDEDEKKILYMRYMGMKSKKIESYLDLKDRQIEYKTSNIKKKLTSCIKT